MIGVLIGVVVSAALIAYYIVGYLMVTPPAVAAPAALREANLTLQTVASLGFGPHPDWVSYLVKNPQGQWVHSTILRVPAHSLVHVTIYQYDTATGLRNPFWGRPQGRSAGDDGQRQADHGAQSRPRLAHVRDPGARRQRPAQGRRRQREEPVQRRAVHARRGAHDDHLHLPDRASRARYRWQCFVPCAAGFILGFGGPMQSLGYMDGLLHVV